MKTPRLAFTLIELLIVVAIIAILAAIAVPNFLEAQVRSKVSRVKSDQRTLGTAIESYAVDWNCAPPAQDVLNNTGCVPFDHSLVIPDTNLYAQSRLTTPIAYLSSIPSDPFRIAGFVSQRSGLGRQSQPYLYNTYDCTALGKNFLTAARMGYRWAMQSTGPSLNQAGTMVKVLIGVYNNNAGTTSFAYDPSNGSTSWGYIIRTNKGIFSVAGS